MSNNQEQPQQQQRRTVITKVNTQSKSAGRVMDFSHLGEFELTKDELSEGKLVLSLTEYDPSGNKPSKHIQHFLPIAKARAFFHKMLNGTLKQGIVLENFGGGTGAAVKQPDIPFISRTLKIEYKDKDKDGNPLRIGPAIQFSLEIFEADKTPNGGFMKKGNTPIIAGFIMINLQVAQEAATTVTEYLRAKEIAAMLNKAI